MLTYDHAAAAMKVSCRHHSMYSPIAALTGKLLHINQQVATSGSYTILSKELVLACSKESIDYTSPEEEDRNVETCGGC